MRGYVISTSTPSLSSSWCGECKVCWDRGAFLMVANSPEKYQPAKVHALSLLKAMEAGSPIGLFGVKPKTQPS